MTKEERNNRIIKRMWQWFCIFLAFVIVMFILIYNGIIGYMPPIEELKNPTDKFASSIYTADGVEMGRYYKSKGNRVYVDFDQMSKYLSDALIATEDVRFESHSGIDGRAIIRSVVKRLLLGQRSAGGGSTITQQLAKQLYSPKSTNAFERIFQKPVEWIIALKLERYYTKDEIIKMYFNQFDFLNNAVGIKTAAYVYFGKDPKDLNIQEAATLVGMVKNPSYFNPVRYPERTTERRNVVFDQMAKAGKITDAECESLKKLPLVISFHRVDHNEGLAPYFREELRRVMSAKEPRRDDYPSWNQQAFVDDSIAWATNPLYGWCTKNHKPNGDEYDIYTDGLKIYTTIDSRMQTYAEQAVYQHMSRTLQPAFFRERGGSHNPYSNDVEELTRGQKNQLINKAIHQSERYRVLKESGMDETEIMQNFHTKTHMNVFTYGGGEDSYMTPLDSLLYTKSFLRCSIMSMDPLTGYVKAYVGGPNFKFFKYDMVSTGRRQIGSTIKPFLYTYAMEEGYTPCDRLLNTQPTIIVNGKPWSPRNSGHGRIGQMVDLRWALTYSNNWISARLMEHLSPVTLVRTMHNFGITNKLDPVASLCLGPCEVSLREMVSAYTAFANKGMRVAPLYVSRICDNKGNVIAEFTPQQTEVISEEAYYKILSILLNVVDAGTGARLRYAYDIQAQMGGKTGTTNYNADGWFMGFTPELVTGVWVGGDERYIHFNSMAYGQGAEMALPIYGIYMKKVYGDASLPYTQDTKFVFPKDFSPCKKDYIGGGGSSGGTEKEEKEEQNVEPVEGVFD
jgi:penicillin-binding protein 1A